MGKYQLIRKLATGGMAEVFLAKAAGPMGFEKTLVLKRILPHLVEDPVFVEMFLSEAKLAARLNHANVVQIFDFGTEGGAYFIAMEHVDGLDLRTLSRRSFQRGSPISYPLGARILAMACEGLAYAHELVDPETRQPLGLIHRDISPDNILVSRTGGVKVLDFGIAKAASVGQRTRSNVLKGKVAYMAPEYLMGQGSDARADIYALGVVLFELIAGRKPFQADNDVLLMHATLTTPVPDVRTLRADVPEDVVRVVSRALAKNRDERYQSCREMLADIERFLFRCGEPVGALQLGELVSLLEATPPAETSQPPLAREQGEGQGQPNASPQKTGLMGVNMLQAPSEPPQPPVASSGIPPTESTPGTATQFAVTRIAVRSHESSLTAAAPASSSSLSPEEPLLSPPAVSPPAEGPVSLPVEQRKPSEPAVVSPRPQGRQRTSLRWWVPTGVVLMLMGTGYVTLWSPKPSTKEQLPSQQEPLSPQPVEHTAVPPLQSDGGSVVALQDSPEEGATPEQEDAGLPQEPKAQPAAQATLRVSSNLAGKVRINGRVVGQTPLVQAVEPGTLHITISGNAQGHSFDKSRVVELRAEESQEVAFSIQKVNVTIRGRPDDLRAVAMDERPLQEGVQTVSTYEGRHRLKLLHPPSGKTYSAECQVKTGDKLCRFSVAPR